MLDKTDVIKRVPFDAKNVEHRKAVYTFIKTGKWAIYFEIPKNCTNLPYMLMEKVLLQFAEYESQELQNRECIEFVGSLIN